MRIKLRLSLVSERTNYVVSAGFDGAVKMWDISSGRVLRDLRGHKDRIMGLWVSPTEESVADMLYGWNCADMGFAERTVREDC